MEKIIRMGPTRIMVETDQETIDELIANVRAGVPDAVIEELTEEEATRNQATSYAVNAGALPLSAQQPANHPPLLAPSPDARLKAEWDDRMVRNEALRGQGAAAAKAPPADQSMQVNGVLVPVLTAPTSRWTK